MVNLFINDIQVEVPQKTTILQACDTVGIDIPRFCFHERLLVAGNCRMCLVEIEKSPKPVPGCTIQVMEGMKVYTKTPLVKKAQEAVLEFLLINHPLDCPICDQGGECDLQDQSLNFGSDSSRFYIKKRGVEDKNLGPIVKTVMTRCIHCTRCVRFVTEVAGVPDLGTTGRGKKTEIGTYISKVVQTELSGNVVDLCPVGALTSKPYAFKARPWELKSTDSIDILDSLGSNIVINNKGNNIVRVLPRLNENLNEEWITDKARYSFDGVKRQRLNSPLLKVNGSFIEVTWEDAFNEILSLVKKNPSVISFLLGQLNDLESISQVQKFQNSFKNSVNIFTEKKLDSVNSNYDSISTFQASNMDFDTLKPDLILLVCSDIKSNLPLLNVKLRNYVLQTGCKVGIIGRVGEVNFPYTYLGLDESAFFSIVEGTHYFTQDLINSSNPLVLVGEDCLSNDLNCVQNILSNINSSVIFNVLNSQIAFSGLYDNGINSVSSINELTSSNILFRLGDSFNIDSKPGFFQIYIGHHGFDELKHVDLILPSLTFMEKDSSYMNFNGLVQKSNSVSSDFINARSEADIIKNLIYFLSKECTNDFFSGNTDSNISLSESHHVQDLSLNCVNTNKFNFSCTKPSVEEYYLNNVISRSSKIMQECQVNNVKKTNF